MGKTIRNKIAGLLAAVSTCGFLMNGVSKVSAREFSILDSNNLTVNNTKFSDVVGSKNPLILSKDQKEFGEFLAGLMKNNSEDVIYGFAPVTWNNNRCFVLVAGKKENQTTSWTSLPNVGDFVPVFTDDVKEAFINKWNELEKNQVKVVEPKKKEENKNSEPNNLNNDVKKEEKENNKLVNPENNVNNEEKENNKPVEGQRSGLFMKIGISGLIVLSIVTAYALSNGSSSSTDGGNIGVLDVYDF